MKLLTAAKTAAVAGVFGLAMAAAATPASAYSYSRCDADGMCYRVHCDFFGDNCSRTYDRYDRYSYDYRYRPNAYGRHYVCDADGDNCRFVYDRDYYDRDYYDRDYFRF